MLGEPTHGAPPVGSYLTDGVFLFRVASRVGEEKAELVELEDCYGLDLLCIPADLLRERSFSVVTPTSAVDAPID